MAGHLLNQKVFRQTVEFRNIQDRAEVTLDKFTMNLMNLASKIIIFIKLTKRSSPRLAKVNQLFLNATIPWLSILKQRPCVHIVHKTGAQIAKAEIQM